MTRQLCGYAYLDMDFASTVLKLFTVERFRAHGAPLGIDQVAVVRHARRAERLRSARDVLLGLCLVALVLAMVGAAAATQAGAHQARPLLHRYLNLGGWALLAAVLLVYGWGWFVWRTAHLLHWGEAGPREGARPLDSLLEAELDALDEANVRAYATTYDGRRPLADGEHPFVGHGSLVMETVWPGIDVGRAAEDKQGHKLTIKPFDGAALHAYVAEQAAGIAGIDGLRARDRLYVRGHHVRDLGTELLPDPMRRPVTRIGPDRVAEGVAASGNVRTYLSLELVGSDGTHVETMFLRARLTQSRLSWEVSAYAVPPLWASIGEKVDELPLGPGERAFRLLGYTLRELRPQLFRSVGRVSRRTARPLRDRVRLWSNRRRIVRRQSLFDYGTLYTLRAYVSDGNRWDYLQRMDARDTLQRLQQAVLLATERFLTEHNVDASDLKRIQKVVHNQSYNFNGPVVGQNMFGNHGTNYAGRSPAGSGKGKGTGTGTGGSEPVGGSGAGASQGAAGPGPSSAPAPASSPAPAPGTAES
ncbi:hypothetical protein AB0P17_07185 [Streptomyces sp. NPDC088124]|uniref:hypothetical protein n=1 Tax=Streptomyces sp. NPDC088124 TaxID=3154654 RepID=UPI0034456C4D